MDRRMKFFVALLGGVIVSSALADDVAVGARMTCADINAKISELSAVVEPDTETIDELTKLKADYRRSCSRAARGRKTSAGVRVVRETADVAESVSEADEEPADEEKAQDAVEEVKEVEKTEEKPAEEKSASAEEKPEADKKVDTEKESEDMPEQDTPSEDEILAMELANLDAGLCVDGTEPNKFGCCEGELFKDLGNAIFACCPKEGDGECFPPIK